MYTQIIAVKRTLASFYPSILSLDLSNVSFIEHLLRDPTKQVREEKRKRGMEGRAKKGKGFNERNWNQKGFVVNGEEG